jgi:hypothetical protein
MKNDPKIFSSLLIVGEKANRMFRSFVMAVYDRVKDKNDSLIKSPSQTIAQPWTT